jgi:hypothetical protein
MLAGDKFSISNNSANDRIKLIVEPWAEEMWVEPGKKAQFSFSGAEGWLDCVAERDENLNLVFVIYVEGWRSFQVEMGPAIT